MVVSHSASKLMGEILLPCRRQYDALVTQFSGTLQGKRKKELLFAIAIRGTMQTETPLSSVLETTGPILMVADETAVGLAKERTQRAHSFQLFAELFADLVGWLNSKDVETQEAARLFCVCVRRIDVELYMGDATISSVLGVARRICDALDKVDEAALLDVVLRLAKSEVNDIEENTFALARGLSGSRFELHIAKFAFRSAIGHVNLSECSVLKTIGERAFDDAGGDVNLSGCSALEEIGEGAFESADGNVNLRGCMALETIGQSAFAAAEGDVNLTGCMALETIGKGAFFGALGDVNLSECRALETIGESVFFSAEGGVNLSGCTALQTIGKEAFFSAQVIVKWDDCPLLENVDAARDVLQREDVVTARNVLQLRRVATYPVAND